MQHVVKHVGSEKELDAALALYEEVFGIKAHTTTHHIHVRNGCYAWGLMVL
jgi:hypothetical protein